MIRLQFFESHAHVNSCLSISVFAIQYEKAHEKTLYDLYIA